MMIESWQTHMKKHANWRDEMITQTIGVLLRLSVNDVIQNLYCLVIIAMILSVQSSKLLLIFVAEKKGKMWRKMSFDEIGRPRTSLDSPFQVRLPKSLGWGHVSFFAKNMKISKMIIKDNLSLMPVGLCCNTIIAVRPKCTWWLNESLVLMSFWDMIISFRVTCVAKSSRYSTSLQETGVRINQSRECCWGHEIHVIPVKGFNDRRSEETGRLWLTKSFSITFILHLNRNVRLEKRDQEKSRVGTILRQVSRRQKY